MKNIKSILLILSLLNLPVLLNSQEEKLLNTCTEYLNSPYIPTGQPLRAFLTGDEVAEFHAILFEGSIYRLVACSKEIGNITFSVFDKNRNLLFSSSDYNDVNFWDFKINGSIECIIEAKLDNKKSTSGMAMLLLGFKSQSN